MQQLMIDDCGCTGDLYAREQSHRLANGLQQAIAAIHLVRRHGPQHLDAAIDRLTGVVEMNALLSASADDPTVDLVDAIMEISAAAARSLGASGVTVMVHGQPLVTTGARAKPLLMAVAELVSNAIRHGLGPGGGAVAIDVFDDGDRTDVLVEDDGRLRKWGRVGGQGQGIVDALAARLGGAVSRSVTPMGSATIAISVPSIAAAAMAPAGSA